MGFDLLVAVWQRNGFKLELDAISSLWFWIIISFRYPQQKVSFTHHLVSDADDLVKIVKMLLRVIYGIGNARESAYARHRASIVVGIRPDAKLVAADHTQSCSLTGLLALLLLDNLGLIVL